MSRYVVSPQEAYVNGGSPRGELCTAAGMCPICTQQFAYYSIDGLREREMTGYCEPCFDFSMLHPDDREEKDQWMSLVERKKKEE